MCIKSSVKEKLWNIDDND